MNIFNALPKWSVYVIHIIILFIITISFYVPFFQKAWCPIDDYLCSRVSEQPGIKAKIKYLKDHPIDRPTGRFRPMVTLITFIYGMLTPTNALNAYIFRFLIAFSLIVFLFTFIYQISSRYYVSYLSIAMLFILPSGGDHQSNTSNFVRLYNMELVLYFFVLLYFLIMVLLLKYSDSYSRKKNIFLYVFSLFALFFAYMSKETSLVMLPFTIIFTLLYFVSDFVSKKKHKNCIKPWIFSISSFQYFCFWVLSISKPKHQGEVIPQDSYLP